MKHLTFSKDVSSISSILWLVKETVLENDFTYDLRVGESLKNISHFQWSLLRAFAAIKITITTIAIINTAWSMVTSIWPSLAIVSSEGGGCMVVIGDCAGALFRMLSV
jgi:hypothetical protein